jgi:methyl-accepting chemotaxis protein
MATIIIEGKKEEPDITERPGRKALFTGAASPQPPVSSPAETAAARESEKTIADLKKRLEIIVSSNPVPTLLTTPALSIIEANSAFIRMSGISADELLKENLKNFRIVSQKGETAKVAVSEKRRTYGEVIVELPSGTHILEQYCIPIMDNDEVITDLLFIYNDITEQKKIWDEIEKIRSCSEAIVHQNPMPIIIVDMNFHIRDVNEAYARLSGIGKVELFGMSLHDFRVLDQSGEGLDMVIREKRQAAAEVLVEFPGGVKRLQQYGIPVRDNHGNVTSILVVYDDISGDRKKMDEIAELHRISDMMFQQNPVPMLMTSPDFSAVEANAAYSKMSGIPLDRDVGMSLREAEILEQKGEGARVAVEKKRRAVGELTVELPSGTKILEQYVIPVLNAKNVITRLLFVYNEVTEQRKSRVELQKKKDEVALLRLRSDSIISQNPMPIMLMNTAGKILSVNDAFITLTGLSRDRLIGMDAGDFKILEQFGEGFKKVISEHKRSSGEFRIEFPSGVRILQQYCIPVVDPKGVLQTIVCVYNDVTLQREQERKIQLMTEAARADTELLLASVSELRTALAKVANGDLTFRVSVDETDPLGRLRTEYNLATGSIRAIVSDLSQVTNRLDAAISETIRRTEEIAGATVQAGQSLRKAAENSKLQMTTIGKISGDVRGITASIEKMASSSRDVMIHAGKVSGDGANAAANGQLTTTQMLNMQKISRQNGENIVALNEQIHSISGIITLISGIASQTNLLALNAAIESARAGEHGHGFSVVAGGIKNLAGETEKATSQLESLIRAVQAKSEQSAGSAKTLFAEMETSIGSVNMTVDSCTLLIEEADTVSEGATEITRAAEDLAECFAILITAIESLLVLATDNQRRMEEIAARAQETQTSAAGITGTSAELAEIARQSRNIMGNFRLN